MKICFLTVIFVLFHLNVLNLTKIKASTSTSFLKRLKRDELKNDSSEIGLREFKNTSMVDERKSSDEAHSESELNKNNKRVKTSKSNEVNDEGGKGELNEKENPIEGSHITDNSENENTEDKLKSDLEVVPHVGNKTYDIGRIIDHRVDFPENAVSDADSADLKRQKTLKMIEARKTYNHANL